MSVLALALASCRPGPPAGRGAGSGVDPATTPAKGSAPPAERPPHQPARPWRYPLHTGITTTVFWCGERASADNGYIANLASAWDERWSLRFGGEDTPDRREGYHPAAFVPRENPFYFALPYNDFDGAGHRKRNYRTLIPWAASRTYGAAQSVVKNRWVQVNNGRRACYGQWEDVGPYLEDDERYVFGAARPGNRRAPRAGLDVSPAMRDCLGVGDVSTLSWRFVDDDEVPAGPWKAIITTRNP